MAENNTPLTGGNRFLDLDRLFVSKTLIEGVPVFLRARGLGITSGFLTPPWDEVWGFVEDYYQRYGALPTSAVVENKCGVKILGDVKEDAEFLIQEVRSRQVFNDIKNTLPKVVNALEARDPEIAYKTLDEVIRKIRQRNLVGTEIVDILNLKDALKEAYIAAKEGRVGIEIPFPTLYRALLGWQKGEVYGVFGRSKKGKSQLLTVFAHHAWKCGHRVLFASPEMTKVSIARRFYAIELKLPLSEIRSGTLGEFREKDFFTQLETVSGQPFYLLADVANMHYTVVEAAIDKIEPDLLLVDGIYLIGCPGETVVERMGNMADILKEWARRYQIPIIVSSQFNRTVKQGASRAQATSIALSDRLAWNLDACFGIFQPPKLKAANLLRFVPLLLRDVEDFDEIILQWDFQLSAFRELEGYQVGNWYKDNEGDGEENEEGGEEEEKGRWWM